jgi:hypothetical protein
MFFLNSQIGPPYYTLGLWHDNEMLSPFLRFLTIFEAKNAFKKQVM